MTELSLVPLPVDARRGTGPAFVLTPDTAMLGDADAAVVLHRLLATRTGLRLRHTATPPSDLAAIELSIGGSGPPESYRLDVTASRIRLRAADAAGLFYACQTLVQLVHARGGVWLVPAVTIGDAPRFGYRGVMLDVARHFHDVATVSAYIERAASLKFNVLHLHLSDDQGWRLELRSRPELTARASADAADGDPGGFYSQADYRAILAVAAAHHMTVVPEFDMPGHTHAVGLAYPEIVEPPAIDAIDVPADDLPVHGEPYRGIAVGFSSLRIHDEATYAFVADVFAELAALTPGPYLHFGGDEALGTAPDDFATFVRRTSEIIADLGKIPVAWHEAGAARTARGTVGQYWGFVSPSDGADDRARAFVARGGRVILSPADAAYLDMKPHPSSPLGLTWANGPTSVERAYRWEPSSIVPGLADDDILGVEAPLWTETVRSLADIDALAFPRIAAIAEAAWSPATGAHPDRTWESFRVRTGGLGALWTTLDIRFAASPEIAWRG